MKPPDTTTRSAHLAYTQKLTTALTTLRRHHHQFIIIIIFLNERIKQLNMGAGTRRNFFSRVGKLGGLDFRPLWGP